MENSNITNFLITKFIIIPNILSALFLGIIF